MKHGVSQNQNVNPCAQLERYQVATPFWWESRSAFSRFEKSPNLEIWSKLLPNALPLSPPPTLSFEHHHRRLSSRSAFHLATSPRSSIPPKTSHSTDLAAHPGHRSSWAAADRLKTNLRERLPDVVELYTRDWLSVSILKELNFTCYSDEMHQSLLCIDQNGFIRPM